MVDEKAKKRLEHIKAHLESDLNIDGKINNIINNRGNLSACASGLSSHAFATGIFSWFECGNLNDFKKWMCVSSRLEKLYYKYQEGSPDWGRGFPNLFKPLFSDNEEIIDWISNYELAYDSSRIDDPSTLDFLAYQSIVAIRGDWENLISRCKLVIANPSALILKDNKLLDYQFFLALGEGDVAGMEEVIALMISNEKKRAHKNGGGYTKDLIAPDAAIYSKIAWRSGYFVDVRSPYVPYDWLPVKPLDMYELVYDFLN